MLEADKKRLIRESLRALAASHAAAVAQIEETMAVLLGALELDDPANEAEPRGNPLPLRKSSEVILGKISFNRSVSESLMAQPVCNAKRIARRASPGSQ